VVLAVVTGGYFVVWLLGPPGGGDWIGVGIAMLVAVYSVGAHTAGWQAVAGVLGTLVVVLALVAGDADEADPGSYLFFLLVVGGPWLAGRAIRQYRLSGRHLEARAQVAEREREERARAAVTEERVRIARELHDVVAHAISVIVVQARGGRRMLRTEPAEAREAFDSIEATGRAALTEMRRLLGVLRRDDEEIALAPEPSLRYLDVLTAQLREAGLVVEVSVEGEPIELLPGVDLCAYRIIQEALTNVLKHGGTATARVVVRYHPGELELEIADNGLGSGAIDKDGHGLVGMRERVALYGGKIDAGPRHGGFAVTVRLPLESDRA
jgi:signal transduction histidine kinase